jgi:hypothetical protein
MFRSKKFSNAVPAIPNSPPCEDGCAACQLVAEGTAAALAARLRLYHAPAHDVPVAPPRLGTGKGRFTHGCAAGYFQPAACGLLDTW